MSSGNITDPDEDDGLYSKHSNIEIIGRTSTYDGPN